LGRDNRLGEGCREGALVGLRFGGGMILAEDRSYWKAYHKLVRKAVRAIL